MKLEEKDVRHVAKLSAIALRDEEVAPLVADLSEVLDYFERLSRVSTQGVLPTSHVHGVVNAFREDLTKESTGVEDLAKMAPDFKAGSFRVPRVI